MKKAPSPIVSLIPIIVLVLLLFATIRTFGSDALSGGSQVSLLTTTAICILIGMVFYKIPWKDYELAITNNIAGVATAIIILLIIGALSGIWMISGVVPTLIYYGMQIIHPSFFLASTCIICALISKTAGLPEPLFQEHTSEIKYLLYPKPPSWPLLSQTLPCSVTSVI